MPTRRTTRRIIVHHTATAETYTPKDLERDHAARGIARPGGYHELIHRDRVTRTWRISPIRAAHLLGAHDEGQNSDSYGIALAGNYQGGKRPDRNAWLILVAVVTARCLEYGLDADDVEGHREHEPATTPTACPGFDPAWLRNDVARQLRLERGKAA